MRPRGRRTRPPGRTRSACPGPCGRARPPCRSRCRRRTGSPRRSPGRRCPGVSPPDRISGGLPGCRRASCQSKLSPVPPGARSECASSMWKSVLVGPQRLHLSGVADTRGLDHPAPGSASGLLAVGGALVPVELEQGEAAHVGRLRHVVERRVHEHAGELEAPVQLRADRLGLVDRARARAVGPEDHPERPGAEVRRQLGVLERRDAADLDAGHSPPMVAGARPWGSGARARGRRALRVLGSSPPPSPLALGPPAAGRPSPGAWRVRRSRSSSSRRGST